MWLMSLFLHENIQNALKKEIQIMKVKLGKAESFINIISTLTQRFFEKWIMQECSYSMEDWYLVTPSLTTISHTIVENEKYVFCLKVWNKKMHNCHFINKNKFDKKNTELVEGRDHFLLEPQIQPNKSCPIGSKHKNVSSTKCDCSILISNQSRCELLYFLTRRFTYCVFFWSWWVKMRHNCVTFTWLY